MANICSAEYTVTGDYEQLCRLANLIVDTSDGTKKLPNGEYSNVECGVYYLVEGAGLNPDKYSCRGTVYFDPQMDKLKDGQYGLRFYVDSAWEPLNEALSAVTEKLCPDAAVYFHAEEIGCNIFVTNDPALEDCVYICTDGTVENVSQDFVSDTILSEKEVTKELQKYLDSSETDLDKLLSELEATFDKSDKEFYFTCNRYSNESYGIQDPAEEIAAPVETIGYGEIKKLRKDKEEDLER